MTRRKAALCALMLATIALFTACTMVEAAPLSAQLLTQDIGPAGPQQVGTPDALVVSEDSFSYMVLYPKTDMQPLDEALSGWAQKAVADAVTARTMSADGRLGGKLLVRYESHWVKDRFVGVAEVGQYQSQGSAGAVDYIKTFSYDTVEQRLLSSLDLFPYTVHPMLFGLIEGRLAALNPGLDAEALDVNAAWLEPVVLTEDGVEFILRENRLGLESWPDRLEFSYEALNGILMLPGGAEAHEATTEPATGPSVPDLTPQLLVQADEIDPDKPMIALTFDDGPSAITGQLLDLLERHNVPATFFMIGRQVSDYTETVRRMAEQGCQVASHTWDHPNLNKQTAAVIMAQLNDTADAIEAASGVRPILVRPPYGEANADVRALAGEMGYYLINWSIDTLDWKSKDAQAVYEHIMKTARDGYIVLCHDLYQSTYEAMELAIPALLEQGYQFVTVSDLLELDGGARETGVIYRHR